MYIYIYIYIFTQHIYTTCIYTFIFGLGHIPPAFCDISKSHELKQFRVKGLGYMSLGFRLPNFSNSAGPSGLGLLGKLGNWEVCTSTDFPISQIVLGHLGWDYLGNWEVCTCNHFPISQIVLSQMG